MASKQEISRNFRQIVIARNGAMMPLISFIYFPFRFQCFIFSGRCRFTQASLMGFLA